MADHPVQRIYGRRQGRPLSDRRKAALTRLPAIAIDRASLREDASINPRDWFKTPVEKIWFEIGFGQGEHLLARMQQSPDDGFIGAEPFITGVAALIAELPDPPPQRLRLHDDDAMMIARSLTPASLDGIYILNPDPWPKDRHHKRRIISPENLDDFARVLKPGAQLIMSTDVEELANWMRDHTMAHAAFTPTPETLNDPHTPPTNWPLTTRYMAWGQSEGRRPHFLIFNRK